MGGIPRGALSGPLQSPFSSLSRPGTTQSAPSISDRGQRQQGLLHDLPGYGPAFSSLPVEASLMFMPFSRQEQIAKDGDPAAWTLCTNGETHFTLVQDHRTC